MRLPPRLVSRDALSLATRVLWNVGLDGTLYAVTIAGDPVHCVAEAWTGLFK